jgi:cell division protein FtsB
MRWLVWLLVVLFVLLQYKLWLGDGSLAEVWDLYRQVEQQKIENQRLQERNQALEAEVQDLKQGLESIEERAREELGMIKDSETFYQIIEEPAVADERR